MPIRLAAFVLTVVLGSMAAGSLQAQTARAPLTDEEKTAWLAADLKAISRTAELADKLGDVRQLMLAMIDQQIGWLREARTDGTYRWASLQREEGGRRTEQKNLERVWSESDLHEVSVSASSAYRVLISVPSKRGVFSSNNRVFVRNVVVDSIDAEGKKKRTDLPVNVWVDPGDSHGIAIPDIERSVEATANLGVESGGSRAVADVILLEPTLADDPLNPFFPAVRRLVDIRTIVSRGDIRRGELKTAADEALLDLPGELEKRVASQREAMERRLTVAMGGELLGTIEIGDATPDVIAKLERILRLLSGPLEQQAGARSELEELIRQLQPAAEAVLPRI
jgi:hypothetical protein